MFSLFFIHRPKFAFVISIIITLAGIIAIKQLPVAQYPKITPSTILIKAKYTGANAETVEKTVTNPIETQVNGVKRMMYISSKSASDGSVSINVSLDIGSDGDLNTVNVKNREAIAEAVLPENVRRNGITVKEASPNMLCVIDLHSTNKKKYDETYLSNYLSVYIEDRLARIPGVGNVSQFGDRSYSFRIWLDPNKLNGLGLTPNDVINAIKEQNVQAPVGQIGAAPISKKQKFVYTIQTQGRLSTVKAFENIIVRAKLNGATIKLKDIARIELGAVDYSITTQLNGNPSGLLAIYQLPSANGLDIIKKVKKELAVLSKSFPPGLEANVVYDTTKFVEASVKEVIITLFVAVLLVVIVTYLFLQDWRATLIPTLAIPVSLIGTFAVLFALGYSINLITLFGLILAIGIVVDDAITVIESVKHKMDVEQLQPVKATEETMKLVTSPVIATTLVLFAVFVPVMFLPGMTGVLYRQFAVTIAIAVLISSINALTLSPALCASILKPNVKPLPLFNLFNRFFDALTRFYMKWVDFLVKRTSIVVLLLTLIVIVSGVIYKFLPTGFIPTEDQGFFMVNVQLPPAAAAPRTNAVIDRIIKICRAEKGVKDVITVSGYSILSGAASANSGLAIVTLKPWEKRGKNEHQRDIIRKVQRKFMTIKEGRIFAFSTPAIPGLGTTGGFEFILQDYNARPSRELERILRAFIARANQQPELQRVNSTFQANVPQIYLDINRQKAKKLGVQLNDIFQTLQVNLGSVYVNDFNLYGRNYRVIVQADKKFRDNISKLRTIYVRDKDNHMVPLATLVTHKQILGPQVIEHYNLYRSAKVSGAAAPGFSSGQAIKAMERVAKEMLPSGYGYEWTSMAYQEILAGNQISIIFSLALIFIYLFLVAQYESWLIPLAVMCSVPIALFGALALLWILKLENNIYTQVGFVLLFGLATKTAILIVEFAKEQHDVKEKSILEAATNAAKLRFRPVLMTALSFVLGVIPLVIATGAGAASRRTLGSAVFGGMLFSAVVATVLVPVFYVIFQKIIEYKQTSR